MLSESWQTSERSEECRLPCALDEGVREGNLRKSQKSWYDKNTRERHLEPGDMVLLLFPRSSSKLLAQWQGPYRMKMKMKISSADYLIMMPERWKKKIFHDNLLKK